MSVDPNIIKKHGNIIKNTVMTWSFRESLVKQEDRRSSRLILCYIVAIEC